jgi:hypothetical protein
VPWVWIVVLEVAVAVEFLDRPLLVLLRLILVHFLADLLVMLQTNRLLLASELRHSTSLFAYCRLLLLSLLILLKVNFFIRRIILHPLVCGRRLQQGAHTSLVLHPNFLVYGKAVLRAVFRYGRRQDRLLDKLLHWSLVWKQPFCVVAS